jgi:subtilisin family serine protease
MNRLLVICGVVLLLVAAPIGAVAQADTLDIAGGDTLTPAALERPETTITRFGQPSWVVEVDTESDAAALADWTNSSDDRHLIDPVDSSNRAVVAAPPAEIGATTLARLTGGLLESTLTSRSYVVSVAPEVTVSYPDPVHLRSQDSYARPSGAFLLDARTGFDAEFAPDGIAWSEDTERSSLADARQAVGSDDVSATGAGVTVAVVDTGASVNDGRIFGNGTAGSEVRIHPDSKSFVTGETVDAAAGDYSAIDDDGGHGSWVAAAIAGNPSGTTRDGVAPDAELLVLQALDPDSGSGDSHDIAQAIRYAADNDADVISMSLGAPTFNQEIAQAVEYAESEGSVVVVATGNSRFRGSEFLASPADTPGATIAVGAANVSQNGSQALPAHFSQVGPDTGADLSDGATEGQEVTVVAPGTRITAPVIGSAGTVTNSTLSGTSMATPLVSGAVAQLLAAEPGLQDDPDAVKERLTGTARRLPDATAAAVGSGHVAADRAVGNVTADETQQEAMTDDARARDIGVRALSDATGGLLFRAVNGGYAEADS